MKDNELQKLPGNWHEREKLRNKGQFWTPPWIAEAMVEYAVVDSNLLFDPATGNGAFYKALIKLNSLSNKNIRFYGTDIDNNILKNKIYKNNSCVIEVRSYAVGQNCTELLWYSHYESSEMQ